MFFWFRDDISAQCYPFSGRSFKRFATPAAAIAHWKKKCTQFRCRHTVGPRRAWVATSAATVAPPSSSLSASRPSSSLSAPRPSSSLAVQVPVTVTTSIYPSLPTVSGLSSRSPVPLYNILDDDNDAEQIQTLHRDRVSPPVHSPSTPTALASSPSKASSPPPVVRHFVTSASSRPRATSTPPAAGLFTARGTAEAPMSPSVPSVPHYFALNSPRGTGRVVYSRKSVRVLHLLTCMTNATSIQI